MEKSSHILVLLLFLVLPSVLEAQDVKPPSVGSLEAERLLILEDMTGGDAAGRLVTQDDAPLITMVRTAQIPTVDGVLDDPCWKDAPLIDRLVQVEPIEGAEPSQKTEIRLLYTDDFLYLGIRCFDTSPDEIVANQMLRDANLEADDRVELVIDTFFDKRNAYYFQINAVGAKGDALIENSGNFNKEWDGIWFGKSSIDDKGWAAEISIPFKTISFRPGGSRWGFNFSRIIRRTNELARWSAPRQDTELFTISDAGILEAITELKQGLGLDIKPFFSAKFLHDRENDRDVFSWDPGFDIFYKVTPSVTASFTANTDFAETEVDERRVNLTRFPLFFPEKRDFFLQDAGVFSGFGGIRRSPIPFHSRRIGISGGGEIVDLLAGIKVTGRVGPVNFGLLDVQMDSLGDIEGKNLAAGRASVNVFEESTIGVIGTVGDPRTNGDNTLIGADFNYLNSHVFGDKTVKASAWFLQTTTDGVDGDQSAFGVKFDYPNDTIRAGMGYFQIDENFNPALGYVSRTGVRDLFSHFRYRWRPENWIRSIDVGYFTFLVMDYDLNVESWRFNINALEIEAESGDKFTLEWTLEVERLTEDFDITDDVIIPLGHYDFQRLEMMFESSQGRPVSAHLETEWGSFFDGHRWDVEVGFQWNASRNFNIGAEYEQTGVMLDWGDFTTRVVRLRTDIYFSPDMSWNTFVQYDNVSDSLGINSRFRWIIEPGRDFFVVLNQGFEVRDWRFRSTASEVTIKVGWTYRF